MWWFWVVWGLLLGGWFGWVFVGGWLGWVVGGWCRSLGVGGFVLGGWVFFFLGVVFFSFRFFLFFMFFLVAVVNFFFGYGGTIPFAGRNEDMDI
ncbi:hypothetical protein RA279_27975, partial [Pseudomonas syringae pv. tagetis]|uniref:hypothetical protein n=1 Tax=Pseudomonas syringae group genomosp. 7 TaxID=251699 RepID=UPI00376FA13F